MFLTNIQDFNYAGLRGDNDEIISCQMYLPMPLHSATTADFFNPLCGTSKRWCWRTARPIPSSGRLLTSGMTLAGVDSIHNGYSLVKTPEMEVVYQPPTDSMFWRE